MSGRRVPGVMRIPARYLGTLLIRGMAIWVTSRLMVVALYMFIGASSDDRETVAAFTQGSPTILAIWTLALSVVLIVFDLHRRHEVMLLNNLGVVTAHAVLLGTVPSVVMETGMAILR
jgi:hypothetical protein